jgi:hypothetical protein
MVRIPNMPFEEAHTLIKEVAAETVPEGVESAADMLFEEEEDAVQEDEDVPDITEEEMKAIFDTIPVYLIDLETKAMSPDPRAARLRRYWSVGEGGVAKIRWGTPGDGTRCIRHLRKYIGPMAPGYCQNLHRIMVAGRVMGKGPGESKEEDTEMTDEMQEMEEKRFFSAEEREKLAGGAAMPDGSFPIKNAEDLKNAIHLVGRAKNPAAAKAHIIKRAKALGLVSQLPESWNVGGKEAVLIDLESKDIQEALEGYDDKAKPWDEDAHPRAEAGDPTGGQFVAKDESESKDNFNENAQLDTSQVEEGETTQWDFSWLDDIDPNEGVSLDDFTDEEVEELRRRGWKGKAGDNSERMYPPPPRSATSKSDDEDTETKVDQTGYGAPKDAGVERVQNKPLRAGDQTRNRLKKISRTQAKRDADKWFRGEKTVTVNLESKELREALDDVD